MNKITPVFILGSARSGTTWLANLLESHADIAATACVEHHGIHESHLFDHTRYCFPEELTCTEFIQKYKDEDYFKLLGLDKKSFCEEKTSRETVFEWFRQLMCEYALKNGAAFWMEKTPKHVIYYDEILATYSDALFVTIERGFRKTILSNLTKYARPGAGRYRQMAEKVLRYELDKRALARLRKRVPGRILSLSYENLAADPDREIARIEQFLKIKETPLESRYLADSSYKQRVEPYKMSLIDWSFVYLLRVLAIFAPFEMQRKVRMRRDKLSSAQFPLYTRVQAAGNRVADINTNNHV